jgi:hypothetical protein
MMRNIFTHKSFSRLGCAQLLAGALVLTGCVADCAARVPEPHGDFRPDTPYSKVMKGAGDAVCWNVKRAFLTQGYILDRNSDSVILTGTKDSQRDAKTNLTIRLQATCVDNKDGTSTVFASAVREISKLQKVRQGWSAGVSIATVTVPTGSENVLQVISRDAIQDPKFYDGFYHLVEGYMAGDKNPQATAADEQKGAAADDKGRHDAANDRKPEGVAERDKNPPARDAGDRNPQGAAASADHPQGADAGDHDRKDDGAGDKGSQ